MSDRQKRLVSIIAFPALLGTLGILAYIFRADLFGLFRSAESIRAWIAARGSLAPLAFIGLQILQVIVFVIPGEVVQVAGGFAFGLWLGTLWSVLGILAGSLVNFMVGRLLGRPFALAVLGKDKMDKIEAATKGGRVSAGFLLLFTIPGIPKDALTYAAGASSLGFGTFIAVSTLGRLPGIVGSSFMGSAVFDKDYMLVIVILSIALALLFMGLFFRQRLHSLVERILSRRER
ncbi:MAG: TVP38/TMEM64 family protein [Spirochaetia bacterium]|jgi:uncharacterized membrane protein YdjX (TVP38/TMEM64 family)|nr:TVP38/TMEM64 family protein [Spirochaetia bacterium]